MARANLNINSAIFDAFQSAQDLTNSIRCLRVTINGESLDLDGIINRQGDDVGDFNLLRETLSPTDANLLIFCLDKREGDSVFSAVEKKTLAWLLFSWVPDGCKVRDKMLYSSSREDLKRSLGLGYFTADYAANALDDVSWELFQASLSKEQNHAFLSESEKLVQEEKAMAHIESNAIKSTAMGVLPFEVTEEAASALAAFLSGSYDWVELRLEAEKVHLAGKKNVGGLDSLSAEVNGEEPRFILVRKNKIPDGQGSLTFFVFSCPENAPIRMKMTMSSSKASVIASATEKGIKFDRTIEIRSSDEIVDQLRFELDPADASTIGSAAAVIQHSKPARPGKGRAKVTKFVADSDS